MQGQPVTLSTLSNDQSGNTGIQLDSNSVRVVTQPKNGSFTVNSSTGDVTYTPFASFTGADTLYYAVCDKNNPVKCDTAMQIITVIPTGSVNSTQAADDYTSTRNGVPTSGNLLNNDEDPEKNRITATPQTTSIPGVGQLVLNADGSYVFTPVPGFSGPVRFPYLMCDTVPSPTTACDSATLYITVNPFDADPDANMTYTDMPVKGDVSTNDAVLPGSNYGTPVPASNNPQGGVITINPDGTYSFTAPLPGLFTYQVPVCPPGQSLNCPLEQLVINVLDKDVATNNPVATTDLASTLPGQSVALATLSNDKSGNIGISLDTSSVSIVDQPNNGTASINPSTGVITYTPAPGFYGIDTLQYRVCDKSPAPGPYCDTAYQIITVLSPLVPNTTQASDDYFTANNGATATGNILANDSDPQKNQQKVTAVSGTIAGKGTYTIAMDGTFTFTPVSGYSGPVAIPYQVCDTVPTPKTACDSATIYLTVTSIDPDPDLNVTNVGVPVSGDVSTNDDVPNGTTYGTPSAVSGNPSTDVPVINPDGTYDFTPSKPGVYVYAVPVCAPGVNPPCPTDTLTITVLDPNSTTSRPVANNDVAITMMDSAVVLNTLLNDKPGYSGTGLNNSTVLRIAGSGPANGTASVNTTTGAITYTPNAGFIGTDTYKYVVCDSLSRCDTAIQQITILPPTSPNLTQATDDYNTITQGGTATGNVLLNDQDPQKNTQSVTPKVDTIPGVGILTLGANGNYTFVPVPGFNGPVNVPYEVCDNGTPVACAQATLYILVNPFDTDPDIHATFVGLPISGDVGTNDKVLGGTTYGTATAIAGNPSNSLPTVSADGSYTFTSNVPGTYQFNVPVCKPGQTSGCELELLTINVLDPNSSNNPPIANTDIANTLMNAPVSFQR